MSTLSFHQGRPRLAEPELPPTLTPNPIHAASRAPSRVLSSLGSLMVYGVLAVGSLALARNVESGPRVLRPTERDVVVDLRLPSVLPPLLPPPPPERLTTMSSVATRPKDWEAPNLSQVVPEEAPNTLPTRNAAYDGHYTADMPVAKDPSGVTPPHLLPQQTPGTGSHLSHTVDVDYRQVRVLRQAPVHYPALARMARVQGPVEVLITIDPGGVPVQVEATGGHPTLQAEAMRCAREWRFEPARVDGQPVSARFRLTIHFRLQ